jgi:hypothetical protein
MSSPISISKQKKIHAMLDAGCDHEQIKAEYGVTSDLVARCYYRRRAYRLGLVDTQYIGQPMNLSGRTYEPSEEEIAKRVAIIRQLRDEEKSVEGLGRHDERSPGIRTVKLTELGIRVNNSWKW